MEVELTRESVDVVYNQYKHFIVVGLTGRCGSGCSTTRGFLCNGEFNMKTLLSSSKNNNATRDLNILINFAERNNILPFHVIKVRDIITSYILDNLNAFYDILKKLYHTDNPEDKFDNYIRKYYSESFKRDIHIEEMCKKNKILWESLDRDIYKCIAGMTVNEYDFLFTELGKICDAIRDFLIKEIDKDAYTIIYQYVGNVIRSYGELATDLSICEQKADTIHCIAKRINVLLKILRRRDWIIKGDKDTPIYKSDVRVVIDSIKNVYESNYLKSRYQSYYLLAITVDDEHRKFRLSNNKYLNEQQMDIIDLREQPSKAKKEFMSGNLGYKEMLEGFDFNQIQAKSFQNGSYIFNLQDVDACIQNADILINNKGSIEELQMNILRYACLMMHPGLITPTDDERCMQIAQTAKINSGCISRQVGAVICDAENNIISIGWNDPSTTLGNECISCIRRNLHDLCTCDDNSAYSFYELHDTDFRNHIKGIMINGITKKGSKNKKPESATLNEVYKEYMKCFSAEIDGLPDVYCFKDVYCSLIGEKNQVHTRAQHGEERAFEKCDKNKTIGGTLYTTSSSCELCAKKALSYNISRIVYIEPYSGITDDHILGHQVDKGIKRSRRDERNMTISTVEPIKVELFTGATQKAYVQLYTPIFPMKDELELRGIRIK